MLAGSSGRLLLRPVALAVAGVLATGAVALHAAPGAARPPLQVIASNLNNPRKIFLGSDGAVYVVEAGVGGPSEVGINGEKCKSSCVGDTASIVRIRKGKETEVVTALVSLSDPLKLEAEGPSDVIVAGGTYYVLMQDMNINAQGVNELGPQLATTGDLLATAAGRVKPRVIANLAVYEARHNPDHGAGPGARYGQPPIDSDPYAFLRYRGGWAVVDAAANDLLWVRRSGAISTLAVFPTQPEKLNEKLRRDLGAPPSLKTLAVQSVPTSVTLGPDGALYVGELTGWPFRQGTARIWRVVPGHKPTLYAKGFTNISDLAFDGPNLLVLEIAQHGLLDPTSPGALIRLRPNGQRTVIASTGLVAPTGLAVGNGKIYISNNGIYPGSGKSRHGELVALPASLGS